MFFLFFHMIRPIYKLLYFSLLTSLSQTQLPMTKDSNSIASGIWKVDYLDLSALTYKYY